jgi:hypothetical protein
MPAGSIERLEFDATDARGALVIENFHTFEAALRAGVGEDLVVVWCSGYVGDAEITLLGRLSLPVGVFADLDPDGIAIVADVASRLGQPVSPLLMTADLLTGPHCRTASTPQLAMAKRLADRLHPEDASGLRALAHQITVTGQVREQETLHDQLGGLSLLTEDPHRPDEA